MNDTLPTSWIWATDDGVNGLRVDTDKQMLHWYDAIGCACDTSLADQPLAEFYKNGVPVGIQTPPDDVMMEIKELVK